MKREASLNAMNMISTFDQRSKPLSCSKTVKKVRMRVREGVTIFIAFTHLATNLIKIEYSYDIPRFPSEANNKFYKYICGINFWTF